MLEYQCEECGNSGKNNRVKACELCEEWSCKNCGHFLEEDRLKFEKDRPAELKKNYYCTSCYLKHIQPALAEYDEAIEKAQNLVLLPVSYKGQIRTRRKATRQVEIKDASDPKEARLSVAYQALKMGFPAVIFFEEGSEKLRNYGYQKMSYWAKGLPAELDSRHYRE